MSDRPESTTIRVYRETSERFRALQEAGGFNQPDLMRLIVDDVDDERLRGYVERRLATSRSSTTAGGNDVGDNVGRGPSSTDQAPAVPARRSA